MTSLILLPTELLHPILHLAISLEHQSYTAQNPNRPIPRGKLVSLLNLSLTCRRFYEILLPTIYSRVRFNYRQEYFSRTGEKVTGDVRDEGKVGCYVQHGHFVKTAVFRIFFGTSSPLSNFQTECIPGDLSPLLPALTNLTKIEFVVIATDVPQANILGNISLALKTCLSLKSLAVNIQLRSTKAYYEYSESLPDTPLDIGGEWAKIEELKLNLEQSRSVKPRSQTEIVDMDKKFWLIELIAKLFDHAFTHVKKLDVTPHFQASLGKTSSECKRRIAVLGAEEVDYRFKGFGGWGFGRYFEMDWARIRKLGVRDVQRMDVEQLEQFIRQFDNLESLEFDVLDVYEGMKWSIVPLLKKKLRKLREVKGSTMAELGIVVWLMGDVPVVSKKMEKIRGSGGWGVVTLELGVEEPEVAA